MTERYEPEVDAGNQKLDASSTSLSSPKLQSQKPQQPPEPTQLSSGQSSKISSAASNPLPSHPPSDDMTEKDISGDATPVGDSTVDTVIKPSAKPPRSLPERFKFPPMLDREILESDAISPKIELTDQRWYVGVVNVDKSYGLAANLSRYRPSVERGGMSLIQTAMMNNDPGHPVQTIEAGWQRYGDSDIPHFFIYFTTTGYDQTGNSHGGYAVPNADKDSETNDWTRLKKFDPYSYPACHIDGEPTTMNVKWQLIKNSPGIEDGWYLGLNGEWVGYYRLKLFTDKPPNTGADASKTPPDPGTAWPVPDPRTTLADHASNIQVYGEIFDSDYDRHSTDPTKHINTSSDMGSGKRAEEGWTKAAFISNIMRQPKPSSVSTNWEHAGLYWSPKSGESVVPAMYDLIYTPMSPTILHSFCFLGGTGGPLTPGSWSEWDNVSGMKDAILSPSPDTKVTVLQRDTRIDVFVVGSDGKVYTSFWSDDDWSGFNNINEWEMLNWGTDRTPTFFGGYKITAVARDNNHMDLFGVDMNGKVWNAWWVAGQNWNGWRQISGEQNFPPGAFIAAVSRFPGRHDIFVNDLGTVRTASWQDDDGTITEWTASPWPSIGGPFITRADGNTTTLSPTAEILALSRSSDTMEVFVTANDGHVYGNAYLSIDFFFTVGFWTRFGDVGTSAPDPNKDPPETSFLPGARIAGVTRGTDRMDLFVLGPDKNLWWTHWDANGLWAGIGNGKSWESLGSQSVFDSMQSDVVAITRGGGFGVNTVDVFVTGTDGMIYRTAWNDARGTWTSVGPATGWDTGVGGLTNRSHFNKPGFGIAAASRAGDRMSVLMVDDSMPKKAGDPIFGIVKVTEYQGP